MPITLTNLALTSDFPSTPCKAVLSLMKSAGTSARVAWIPPLTSTGRARFPAAQALFESFGMPALQYCDIDEEPDESQLARLREYDVVYVTGGDPLVFRRNIRRCGLGDRLRECLAAGRLIVAASGGAMQFTRNVSPFRLLAASVEDVVAERHQYDGLGIVDFEILPHLNKLDASFLEKLQRYSEQVPTEIVALEDGAAMIYEGHSGNRCVGRAARFRNGIRASIIGSDE